MKILEVKTGVIYETNYNIPTVSTNGYANNVLVKIDDNQNSYDSKYINVANITFNRFNLEGELYKYNVFSWNFNNSSNFQVNLVSNPTFTLFRGGLYVYAFSYIVLNQIFTTFNFTHDYRSESDFYIELDWSVPNANIGNVKWSIEYSIANGYGEQTYNSTTTTLTMIVPTSGAYKHYTSSFPMIFGNGIKPGSIIIARIFRDAANALDTYNNNAFLISAKLKYPVSRFGTLNRVPDINFKYEPYE